jgi:hypothetical protein
MPKGEKLIGQSKRTAPPCFSKKIKKGEKLKAKVKTILTAKGRTFLGGALI